MGPIVAHDATLEPVDAANTDPDVIVASPRLAGIPNKKRSSDVYKSLPNSQKIMICAINVNSGIAIKVKFIGVDVRKMLNEFKAN